MESCRMVRIESAASQLPIVVNRNDLRNSWISACEQTKHDVVECNESRFIVRFHTNCCVNQMHFSAIVCN